MKYKVIAGVSAAGLMFGGLTAQADVDLSFGPQTNNLGGMDTNSISTIVDVVLGAASASGGTLNTAGNPFFGQGALSGSLTDASVTGSFTVQVDLFTGGDVDTGAPGLVNDASIYYAHNNNGVGVINSTSAYEGYIWTIDATLLPSTSRVVLNTIDWSVWVNDSDYARVFSAPSTYVDYSVDPSDVSGQGIEVWGGSVGSFTVMGLPAGTPPANPANSDFRIKLIGLDVVPVPEPSTVALVGLGVAALLISRRRN
jgi:hypothetical protein